jgi:hypothetical protein
MWPLCSSPAWITCNMGSVAFPLPARWLLALCAIAILFGLAVHLLADAAWASPDLAKSQRSAASVPRTLCSLLAGVILPGITIVGTLPTLIVWLTGCKLTLLRRSCLPPAHPPLALL